MKKINKLSQLALLSIFLTACGSPRQNDEMVNAEQVKPLLKVDEKEKTKDSTQEKKIDQAKSSETKKVQQILDEQNSIKEKAQEQNINTQLKADKKEDKISIEKKESLKTENFQEKKDEKAQPKEDISVNSKDKEEQSKKVDVKFEEAQRKETEKELVQKDISENLNKQNDVQGSEKNVKENEVPLSKTIKVTLWNVKESEYNSNDKEITEKEMREVKLSGNENITTDDNDYYFSPLGNNYQNGYVGYYFNRGQNKLDAKLITDVDNELVIPFEKLANLDASFSTVDGFLFNPRKESNIVKTLSMDLTFHKGKVTEGSVYDDGNILFDISGDTNGLAFVAKDSDYYGIPSGNKSASSPTFISVNKDSNPTHIIGNVDEYDYFDAVYKLDKE